MSNDEYPITYRLGYTDGHRDGSGGYPYDLKGIAKDEVQGYNDGYADGKSGVAPKIEYS